MKATIKKQVIEKLQAYNMKYAAMDWNNKWFCFEKKPNCKDDMWDVKTGHVMYLFNLPLEGFDWRDSLVQK